MIDGEVEPGTHVTSPYGIDEINTETGDRVGVYADGDHGIVLRSAEFEDGWWLLVVGWAEGQDGWVRADLMDYASYDPHPSSVRLFAEAYPEGGTRSQDYLERFPEPMARALDQPEDPLLNPQPPVSQGE